MQATSLLKPRIIDVQNISPVHARVVMEPFERGYGHTLGNALRRILLSSMPGFAPTEVSIDGVLHEYSTLDGVREDVVDLLLNLNGVVLKMHYRSEAMLALSKQGEGMVTAGDIESTHDVEIIEDDEQSFVLIVPVGHLPTITAVLRYTDELALFAPVPFRPCFHRVAILEGQRPYFHNFSDLGVPDLRITSLCVQNNATSRSLFC